MTTYKFILKDNHLQMVIKNYSKKKTNKKLKIRHPVYKWWVWEKYVPRIKIEKEVVDICGINETSPILKNNFNKEMNKEDALFILNMLKKGCVYVESNKK